MPSPEQGPLPQQPKSPETHPNSYIESASYPSEPISGLAYFAIQEIIFNARDNVDLSAYRLQLNNLWSVAVLGTIPPEEIKTQIQSILAKGEPTILPDNVLEHLKQRREQASNLGSWVERHQRPL